ncbi:MAG: hypothetical protein R3B09_09230 [Nannocystaceae bacterium]
MLYGLLLLLLGAALAGFAGLLGGLAWALVWPALSFALVGFAYVAARPAALGKRPDGSIAGLPKIVLAPFLLLTLGVWHLLRLGGEVAAHRVAPGLWVGRRPRAGEVPEGVAWVVDLTAELPAAAEIRRLPGYLCVPVLDGTAPAPAVLRALVDQLRGRENILLHCASGHGRSATVAAALLLERGLARDVVDAESQLRRARPRIRLNAAQRRAVEAMALGTGSSWEAAAIAE